MEKRRQIGGDPFEDPRTLTVSGFSFVTCALSSITQTHMRHSTGQRATPAQSLAATKAKPCPNAGLGGWHPPRITSGHRAGDWYMAPGCSRGAPTVPGGSQHPSSVPPFTPGQPQEGATSHACWKAPIAPGGRMCPMHLPLPHASSLLLHAPQSMCHAATTECLLGTCA